MIVLRLNLKLYLFILRWGSLLLLDTFTKRLSVHTLSRGEGTRGAASRQGGSLGPWRWGGDAPSSCVSSSRASRRHSDGHRFPPQQAPYEIITFPLSLRGCRFHAHVLSTLFREHGAPAEPAGRRSALPPGRLGRGPAFPVPQGPRGVRPPRPRPSAGPVAGTG